MDAVNIEIADGVTTYHSSSFEDARDAKARIIQWVGEDALKAKVVMDDASVVVGSWLMSIALMMKYVQWKKENKGQTSPLLTYMVFVNSVLWITCSLGVAVEVLFQLLPWALGLISRVDVLLTRTLFWYFGHALVYFWLLPAYMAWYVIVPKIIGAKIFSDTLARLSFIFFLITSILAARFLSTLISSEIFLIPCIIVV